MINTRITYIRQLDNISSEGVLIKKFTHTNKGYADTKEIALIYYQDFVSHVLRPVFRYVEISDKDLTIYYNEKSIYEANDVFELMKKYTPEDCFIKEYYIEDWLYNFVNYDGIKI